MACTLWWPTNPELRRARLLAVLGLPPGQEHRYVSTWWWPTTFYHGAGLWVVPLSVYPWLLRAGAKPHDQQTRQLLAAYLAEQKLSMGGASAKRLTLAGQALYPWAQHLGPEAKSYEYQLAGMDRLYTRLKYWHRGALLGDDVGLGKTIQTIGVLERLRQEGVIDRVLVSTSASTKTQWADEITKFAVAGPSVGVAVGTGKEKLAVVQDHSKNYLVVNHDMVRRENYLAPLQGFMATGKRTALVLDETAVYMNPEGKTLEKARTLAREAYGVLCFNATPIENHLADLWGQIDLIDPNVLGTWDSFKDRYVVTGQDGKPVAGRNWSEARERILGVALRRTRADVGNLGPSVVSQIRRVVLDTAQAKAYQLAAAEASSNLRNGVTALHAVAHVQRAALCSDITLANSPSAKIDDLISLMRNELAGERLVVFTRLATVAHWVAQRMKSEGFYPWLITGATPDDERTEIRRRFSDPASVGRLLIGTDAMCRGLNLQAAGVVVNLDLPWNGARLRQRVGRIDRLSQTRSTVLVLNYVACLPGGATVDEYFLDTVVRKQGQFEQFWGNDGVDEIGADADDKDPTSGTGELNPAPVLSYVLAASKAAHPYS